VATQVLTAGPAQTATIKTRESVSQLSGERLDAFRAAMQEFLARPDNRGYQFFAGWHGVPDGICQHHNPLFLPWHRGYLYHFELALQDIDSEVTLPWWNWFDEAGLPGAFAPRRVGGRSNVLYSAPIKPMTERRDPSWPRRTHREVFSGTGPGPWPPPLRTIIQGSKSIDAWQWLMSATSYDEFSARCWRLHDNIHVWVGGEMSDPNWAAFDPLFWVHHSMVDRLWRIWQHDHPGATPGAEIIDLPMTFNRAPSFTPRQVLDVKQLGYDYAGQRASTPSAQGPS
jgi:tyrosinase